MQKYRNRIILGFMSALAIYVCLLLLVDNRDNLLSEGVIAHLRQYPISLLIPVTALSIAAWGFRFGEWQYFLGVVGARKLLTPFDSAIILVSGFVLTVSPGKLAELLKAVVIRAKTGFPIAKSAPAVIAERVVDGLAVLGITFLSVFLAGESLELGSSRFVIIASTGLLLAGLIVVQIRPLAYALLVFAARLPLLRRIHGSMVDFYESSRELFTPRNIAPPLLLGMCQYLSESLAFALILAGFNVPLTWELLLQATFISGVAAAVGALSGVPNGAAVTEISVTALLVAIVGSQHIEFTIAAAATAALLQGFFHKWLRVIAGLAVGFVFRRRLFPATIEAAVVELDREGMGEVVVSSVEGQA